MKITITKGTTRYVFIFKNIVIKVARIRLILAFVFFFTVKLKTFYRRIKRCGIRGYIRETKIVKLHHLKDKMENVEDLKKRSELMQIKLYPKKKYEIKDTIENYLLGGIMENLQEWKYYRKNKNIFTAPTIFSFFGLINVQKRGDRITFWNTVQVWKYILGNSQNEHQPFCGFHTFFNVNNFGLFNGHLKIVDYGSRHIEEFLNLNGEKLYNNFKAPD